MTHFVDIFSLLPLRRRQDDDQGGGGSKEKIFVPATPSSPLTAFLFSAAHTVAVSLLSVDSVQQLPPSAVFLSSTGRVGAASGEDESVVASNLALYATLLLLSGAMQIVVDAYSKLLDVVTTSSHTVGWTLLKYILFKIIYLAHENLTCYTALTLRYWHRGRPICFSVDRGERGRRSSSSLLRPQGVRSRVLHVLCWL